MEFEGAYTAMITPFDEDGELNEEGLRENIRFQIENGIDGIVPVGTTGECATLSFKEHKKVIEISVNEAEGEVPVIAGSGSNNTVEALELTEYAADIGSDAALIVSPYYNKPTQRGLYEHYKTLAQEVDIPQIVYNVPSRTGKNIEADTTAKLSELENVKAVKEASGDVKQAMDIKKKSAEDFNLMSGADKLTLALLSAGGVGAISVASNIVPGKISKMIHSYLDGDVKTAQEIHYENLYLFDSLFLETNPGPVKAAMDILDRPAGKPRLPLVEASEETKERLREVLSELGLL